MKTLTFEFMGKSYTARLRIQTYGTNKNLCIKRETLEKWEDGEYWEPWDTLTVNTDTCRESPFAALIDTNNCGEDSVRWLEENGLGSLTGRQECSGFCVYPEFLFSEEALRELDPKGLEAHLKRWEQRRPKRESEERHVFVIRQKAERSDRNWNYSRHGAFAGKEDAIGYGRLQEARKFLSHEEAQKYIDRELPEWAREIHCPVEVSLGEQMLFLPELGLLLFHGEKNIPPRLLEAPADCMLVWRR